MRAILSMTNQQQSPAESGGAGTGKDVGGRQTQRRPPACYIKLEPRAHLAQQEMTVRAEQSKCCHKPRKRHLHKASLPSFDDVQQSALASLQ